MSDNSLPPPVGEFVPLQPWDVHNQELERQTHPRDWVNPEPAPRYNLVVIGGGTAGLVTAAGAAGLGAKVALIERQLLGGDCLNVGCVPSKALIRAARAVAEVRRSAEFGVRIEGGMQVDFGAVMERMRRLRAEMSPHDSAARFRDLGVDVFLGSGRFVGDDRIEVGGKSLRFVHAVIATGARAAAPPVPGLETVPFLTNETLFSLTELPARLGILGGGPIGCEMAQCLARFGSEVHLIESGGGLLPREDRDAARIIQGALERDGVRVWGHGKEAVISKVGNAIRIAGPTPGHGLGVTVDSLLVAAGRAPNVEGLGLDAVGVAFDSKGVQVDDHLRTTHSRIFACGDVCSRFQFTHAADFQARIVIQNALFRGRARASALQIPWCTYTSPELAHVGLSENEATARGLTVDTFTQDLKRVDRAILDGETEGFVRIHVRRGSDEIVGATVVASHAGDLISEIALAMKGGLGLKAVGATIHPYPTQADAIRKTGDLYNRTRLTPFVKRLMGRWLAWQRR